MVRQQPTSTLFPYTTLFRSRQSRCPHPKARRSRRAAARSFLDPTHNAARENQDRKSTRLNSSHVEISYAVFCLKKKSLPPALRNLAAVQEGRRLEGPPWRRMAGEVSLLLAQGREEEPVLF